MIDGAIRDVDAFSSGASLALRAVTHRGPYQSGPGRMGETISVGGSAISSGDIVVGDAAKAEKT